LFSINTTTGAVTLNDNPNYESKANYSFSVLASDGVNPPSAQAVSLAINNLDEVAPTITSGATATAINENSGAGQVVYTATATDTADISAGVSFSLDGADASLFSINTTTGAVTLNDNPNYESKASYDFTVVATDAGGLTAEKAVTVGVTDVNEAPVITSGATGTVAENAAISTVIYTAVATDVDAGDTRTYSLTGTDSALLDINASTGAVTLKAPADFETKASYDFTVVATDAGGLTAEKAVTVGVTDVNEAPVGLAPTNIQWNAVAPSNNLPSAGAILANLSTVDSDTTSGFTYTLLAGSSTGFSVTPSGSVSRSPALAQSQTYTLNIQTTDPTHLSYAETFTIKTGSNGNNTLTGTSGDDIFYGLGSVDISS
jgi:hypothetical protein